jgi:hypothetical protein
VRPAKHPRLSAASSAPKTTKAPDRELGSWLGVYNRTEIQKTGVELRGFEPLTFCMPCTTDSSEAVSLGLILTGQGLTAV